MFMLGVGKQRHSPWVDLQIIALIQDHYNEASCWEYKVVPNANLLWWILPTQHMKSATYCEQEMNSLVAFSLN